jgi:hypothetical protein
MNLAATQMVVAKFLGWIAFSGTLRRARIT